MTAEATGRFIKASASYANGGCVEVAACPGDGGCVEVRDSKDKDGPTLHFTAIEWDCFLDGAKRGEFDRDRLRAEATGDHHDGAAPQPAARPLWGAEELPAGAMSRAPFRVSGP